MSFNSTVESFSLAVSQYLPITSSSYLNAFILLAAFAILAWVADWIFEKIFIRLTAHTDTDIDDKIVSALKGPIFWLVLIAGVYTSLHSLDLSESTFFYADNLLQTGAIYIGALAVTRVVLILLEGVTPHVAARTTSSLDKEMLPLFRNVARIVIVFIALMLTLTAWDVNVTPFLASAGVVGIALAFAAQSTVANLFGGVAIYFDKPFRIGDRIQLESGEIGDVVEVGIRSSRIRTLEGNLIVIPNDKIANSKILNLHQPFPKMSVKIDMGVAYGSDIAKVKKLMLKAAHDSPNVLKDPAPSVYFMEHGDFALKFTLFAWIADPTNKITATDEINVGIANEFAKAKIDIPFPTQTIYLKK